MRVTRTIWDDAQNPVPGVALKEILDVATKASSGAFSRFWLEWVEFFEDDTILYRPRILRRIDGHGDKAYAFFLTEDAKTCRPLLIDCRASYARVVLAVDSTGSNFNQEANTKGSFVRTCAVQARELAAELKPKIAQAAQSN